MAARRREALPFRSLDSSSDSKNICPATPIVKMSSARGRDRRQGNKQSSDFQKYRDIFPAQVSDETLHTIIRKHKDKPDKQDCIAAEIDALYDEPITEEESWQSTGKQKKKKEQANSNSDRSGRGGRGRDRGPPNRGSSGGRGNGPVARRPTPRPKSTEPPEPSKIPSGDKKLKPHKEEKRPSSVPEHIKKPEPVRDEVMVTAASGAWGGKGLSLAEKMKNELQKKENLPVESKPQSTEKQSEHSGRKSPSKDKAADSSAPGRKNRTKRAGKQNQKQPSTEQPDATSSEESNKANEKEEQVITEEVAVNDLYISGKAMSIHRESDTSGDVVITQVNVESSTQTVSAKPSSPPRKNNKSQSKPSPSSPQGVILGQWDGEIDSAGFSFGNFGDESPDRRKGNATSRVATEAPPELNINAFIAERSADESHSDIMGSVATQPSSASAPQTSAESFTAVGTMAAASSAASSSGPPGFRNEVPSDSSQNAAIQQPNTNKSSRGRGNKGGKDNQQQQTQMPQSRDPFGHTSAPPGMHPQFQQQPQQQQQLRGSQPPYPGGPFGGMPQAYGLDAPALMQSQLMGASLDQLNAPSKPHSDLSAPSSTAPTSTATTTSSAATTSSPAPSTSPNLAYQGQSQPQSQGQPPAQQGYPSSGQPAMGHVNPYFHPYYYNNMNPYFFSGQQPPHNFYAGRGGQNMYPRMYAQHEGFAGGGQGMSYDMYAQGNVNGQYDSSGLNYGQVHMHPGQQPQQQSGSVDGNGQSGSSMEGSSNRQKTGKSGNAGGQNSANGGSGSGNSAYSNSQQSARQEQQFSNMYQQPPGGFPPMMHFPQGPVSNSPVPGGLSSGSVGNAGYSQVGGGHAMSRNNFSGSNRSGVSNSQNSANMATSSAPSTSAQSNW